MNFLLDTNAISALMREDLRLASWLSSVQSDNRVLTCTIARGEILFGLQKLSPGKRRSELEAKALKLFAAVPCEPIPPAAADFYAEIKADQQRRGFSLDENDLWIAATALALSATLVSSDTDFQRIGALAVVVP